MKHKPNFTERDIDDLVKTIGTPGPESIRSHVMAKVAEIDRERTQEAKTHQRKERVKEKPERERE